MPSSTRPRASALLLVLALLIGLAGLGLVAAGGWLIALGGSWYYLLAGLGLVATALLLPRGGGRGLMVYALVVAFTLAWALWEVGLAWWPMAARGDLFFLLGLLLLTPWVARALARRDGAGIVASRRALSLVLASFAVAAVLSWVRGDERLEGIAPQADPPFTGEALPPAGADWTAYGGTAMGQRYSTLGQITPVNVSQLEEAWHYRTGDVRGQPGDPEETTFEVTPLKVGERLFLCTPHQSVVALNATTGQELWRHTPKIAPSLALQHLTCRGLSYQPPPATAPSPNLSADGACAAKLFMPTADGRVLALDPESGKPCARFGGGSGQIDLWKNMPNVKPGSYYSTSPMVVTRSLIVVGGTVLDNVSTQETSGVIRAFDIETGALVWNWDSGRPEDTAPIGPGPTAGRSRAWTRSSAWSTCPWATSRPTSGAASAPRAPSAMPPRWSRSTSRPAACAGISRPCTTTSGTTTCPRSPAWSTCAWAACACRRWCSRPSRASCSCSTAAPASPWCRCASRPRRRAPRRATARRRRSRCRACPSTRPRCGRPTCGAPPCSTSWPAASPSTGCATRAASRRRRRRAR
jgi:quinoprotein glucose dehydrogenase